MTRPKGEKGELHSSEIIAICLVGTVALLLLGVLVWAFLTDFGVFLAGSTAVIALIGAGIMSGDFDEFF